MTTTTIIFQDIDALIISVDELLQTSTAKEAPNMAKELGAESLLNTALDGFISVLNTIITAIAKLHDPLIQADAVIAGLEIVAATLNDFGKGEALNEILEIFEIKDKPFQPVLNGVNQCSNYLATGIALTENLPSPEMINNTCSRLTQLSVSLTNLKALLTTQPSLTQTSGVTS